MAPVGAPCCPVCNSSKTRPSQRRHLSDWTRQMGGGSAWRCRTCRERFFLQADGQYAPAPRPARPAARVLVKAASLRRLRRWWHNSYRWRLQRGRRLARQAFMVATLAVLVGLFLLFLTRVSGRAPE